MEDAAALQAQREDTVGILEVMVARVVALAVAREVALKVALPGQGLSEGCLVVAASADWADWVVAWGEEATVAHPARRDAHWRCLPFDALGRSSSKCPVAQDRR